METAAPKTPAKAAGIVSGSLRLLHLRIAQVCAGNEDIRYYINGVQFELHPGSDPGVLAIATNGHRLIVCRNRDAALSGEAPARFFLKNDQLAQIITAFKRHERTMPHVLFTLDQDRAMVEIFGGDNTRLTFPANLDTAESFPNWRKIMAILKPQGTTAQFSPDYLSDCARIARMVNSNSVIHLGLNGQDAALVTFGDDNIAMALMPLRGLPDRRSETDWLGSIPAPKTWRRA